jgi:hypothetical protein
LLALLGIQEAQTHYTANEEPHGALD